MDFWSRHERSDAAASLHDAVVFERGERVAGGHQADLMNLRQVAFGCDGVAWLQLAGINAFADGALDSLIGRHAVAVFGLRALRGIGAHLLRGPPCGFRFHNKNDILFYFSFKTGECLVLPSSPRVL